MSDLNHPDLLDEDDPTKLAMAGIRKGYRSKVILILLFSMLLGVFIIMEEDDKLIPLKFFDYIQFLFGPVLLFFPAMFVAVAVAIEGGLFTPVLKDAHMKSLSALSAEMKDLATRARDLVEEHRRG